MMSRIPIHVIEEVHADLEKDDTIAPECRIFQNRMMERKEAVESEEKFAEFVIQEQAKQKKGRKRRKNPDPNSDCEKEFKRKRNPARHTRTRKPIARKSPQAAAPKKSKSKLKDNDDDATQVPIPKKLFKLDDLKLKQMVNRAKILLAKERKRLAKERKRQSKLRVVKSKECLQKESFYSKMAMSTEECGWTSDEENLDNEINLKVRCRNHIIKTKLKMDDKFSEICRLVTDLHEVEESKIMLLHLGKSINKEDTPQISGITGATVIDCLIDGDTENFTSCKRLLNDVELHQPSPKTKKKRGCPKKVESNENVKTIKKPKGAPIFYKTGRLELEKKLHTDGGFGEIVWAKFRPYPWWPAMIINGKDLLQKTPSGRAWVVFFGDNTVSEIPWNSMGPFIGEFVFRHKRCDSEMFTKAIREALLVLAVRRGVVDHGNDLKALMAWAESGFIENEAVNSQQDTQICTFQALKTFLETTKVIPPSSSS